MLYLDTSLIVTLLTSEVETAKAQFWMRQQPQDQFVISDWVVTEFYAALSMKVRSESLSNEKRKDAQDVFDRLVAETFERLPVLSEHFMAAARFAERSRFGLRGGDAIHLAMATSTATKLCTRDKQLAEAGFELGCDTLLI